MDNIVLLILAIFLIFVPFSSLVVKICLIASVFLGLIGNVFKFKAVFFKHIIPPNKLNKMIFLFLSSCLLSIVFSNDWYHSQGVFFDRYVLFLALFWVGVWISSKEGNNFTKLGIVFMTWSLVFGIGGIRDILYYSKVSPGMIDRLWSIFGITIMYNAFPLYLTFYLPFNFYIFLLAKNNWLKYIGLLNFLLLTPCLLWNSSRIAWAAVLLSMLLVILLKKKKFVAIGLFFIIIVISISVLMPKMKARIESISEPSKWSYRMPLYKSALKIFKDYPVTGVGIAMYEKAIHWPKYELPKDYPIPKQLILHAHNTYLEVSAEMGIVGLFTFLGIFVVFFVRAFRLLRSKNSDFSDDERAMFMGLVGTVFAVLVFAFGSTIITVGLTVSAYFWLLFGLAAGYLTKKEATIEK